MTAVIFHVVSSLVSFHGVLLMTDMTGAPVVQIVLLGMTALLMNRKGHGRNISWLTLGNFVLFVRNV
jgi:hypothetical protein